MNSKGIIPVTVTILYLICFLYASNSAMINRGLQNDIFVITIQMFLFLMLLFGGLYLNYFFFSIRKKTIRVEIEAKSNWPYAGIRIDGRRRMPCFNHAPFPYLVKSGTHAVEVRYKGETKTTQVGDAWKSTVGYSQDFDSITCTINNEKYDETEALLMEKQMYYSITVFIVLTLIMAIGGFCYITAMMTW